MESVNGVQFLNTTSSSTSFGLSPPCPPIDIVQSQVYMHHCNYIKLTLPLKFYI